MTIMANDSSRAYGDANLVLTGTITGIKNGDGITATYSTTATAASPVGAYAIVPTAVDSNSSTLGVDDVAFVDGTLTITKAPLAVSAANERRLYGDTNSTLIGTLVGVVNGGNDTTTTYSTSADAMICRRCLYHHTEPGRPRRQAVELCRHCDRRHANDRPDPADRHTGRPEQGLRQHVHGLHRRDHRPQE